MHTVVERELELRLVVPPDHSIPVPARLTYRTEDPYAVHAAFHIDSAEPVRWAFARELLIEGVFRPCGHGDVRIWPTRVDGHTALRIALSSPHGEALLEAPAAPVSAWLQRTLRVVAPGSERTRLGIDEALSALLATAPSDDSGEPGI
ncbi:SsgA family sporulation/cell division regulator [Streptomyces gobiensis]|uniref:SsgA family sporulation/cell division regulator n=1 Tax=Streptomyces gobiensis TaxID=2875706 RepID=UPI001E482E0D|nr:SsgA family sporulation/cell division regulator [Streptomyces gobiensis]UGY91665.1 SsgA family sporulation/cell division regulator [Streptomyces gobiensis]